MNININNLEIKHDSEDERFYFFEKEAKDAVVDYTLHKSDNQNVMEITHTYVPEPLRNNGLAEKMTFEALQYADNAGYKVKPSCPFTQHYLKHHTGFQHLIKD